MLKALRKGWWDICIVPKYQQFARQKVKIGFCNRQTIQTLLTQGPNLASLPVAQTVILCLLAECIMKYLHHIVSNFLLKMHNLYVIVPIHRKLQKADTTRKLSDKPRIWDIKDNFSDYFKKLCHWRKRWEDCSRVRKTKTLHPNILAWTLTEPDLKRIAERYFRLNYKYLTLKY